MCVPLGFQSAETYREPTQVAAQERNPIFSFLEAEQQLKDEGYHFYKNIKELDSITYRLIDVYLPDSTFDNYTLDRSTIISCIQTISISEGSVMSRGGNKAFRSSLFLIGNNPYGIKGRGQYVMTVEYYDGVRHVLPQNFQSYKSFREATLHLVFSVLAQSRYNGIRSASSIREFFEAIKRGGYLTAPRYHRTFLIPYAERLNQLTQ